MCCIPRSLCLYYDLSRCCYPIPLPHKFVTLNVCCCMKFCYVEFRSSRNPRSVRRLRLRKKRTIVGSELGRSEQLDSCLLWDSVGVCPPPARQARWRWVRSCTGCGLHRSDRPHIRPLGTEPVPPERRHTKTDTPAVHRIDHPYDMKSRSWWPPLVYSSCFHPDSPRTLFELRRAPGVSAPPPRLGTHASNATTCKRFRLFPYRHHRDCRPCMTSTCPAGNDPVVLLSLSRKRTRARLCTSLIRRSLDRSFAPDVHRRLQAAREGLEGPDRDLPKTQEMPAAPAPRADVLPAGEVCGLARVCHDA